VLIVYRFGRSLDRLYVRLAFKYKGRRHRLTCLGIVAPFLHGLLASALDSKRPKRRLFTTFAEAGDRFQIAAEAAYTALKDLAPARVRRFFDPALVRSPGYPSPN